MVTGADAPAAWARGSRPHVARDRPEVDVLVHEGGQERYPVFLAVE